MYGSCSFSYIVSEKINITESCLLSSKKKQHLINFHIWCREKLTHAHHSAQDHKGVLQWNHVKQ